MGPAPKLHYVPRHMPYNWGKIMENPQTVHLKGARLISAERDSRSRDGHHLAMASKGLLAHAALGFYVRRQGSVLVQHSYLLSCPTRGFPTSANFESKL
jgi:hypothetical protein